LNKSVVRLSRPRNALKWCVRIVKVKR
jgi:hypothetical protein